MAGRGRWVQVGCGGQPAVSGWAAWRSGGPGERAARGGFGRTERGTGWRAGARRKGVVPDQPAAEAGTAGRLSGFRRTRLALGSPPGPIPGNRAGILARTGGWAAGLSGAGRGVRVPERGGVLRSRGWRGGRGGGLACGAGRSWRGNGQVFRRTLELAGRRRRVAIVHRSGRPGIARQWTGSRSSPRLKGPGRIGAIRPGDERGSGCLVRG
jgi:hypothetical protein